MKDLRIHYMPDVLSNFKFNITSWWNMKKLQCNKTIILYKEYYHCFMFMK